MEALWLELNTYTAEPDKYVLDKAVFLFHLEF